MRVRRLTIQNFRGVATGTVDFTGHTLLVGTNNIGKSTVCEALDLVLGPERLFRRPVIDEHDFYCSRYLADGGEPIEISITAILIDLSEEARRRFGSHLRRWDESKGDFADTTGDPASADGPNVCWALPVTFMGRYNRDEDDFEGGTFFAHEIPTAPDEEEKARLGGGLKAFTREHKRLCGFVFLRTLRTGSRALSLQRGSLLDTVLRLGGSGLTEMWQATLTQLRDLDPAVGEIAQLAKIRDEIRTRLGEFVNLATGDKATGFHASELTREHLREVVRLFISTQPGAHPVPFDRLGTGSINLLVFAMLTFIADLKGEKSVIFAMEEPEIALPPHTQRRIVRTVLARMGQTIVTSHSPYVIEQFSPEQIVMLDRDEGTLTGRPVTFDGEKPKMFRTEQRQFAEAILARAVLVVEGQTEAEMFLAAADVLEAHLGTNAYAHPDLAGISIFNAASEDNVPKYGPVFKACGKLAFSFRDKSTKVLSSDPVAKLAAYDKSWISPEKGSEALLVQHADAAHLGRFLTAAQARPDYPRHLSTYNPATHTVDDARQIAKKALEARKGDGYAALFVSLSEKVEHIPDVIREVLLEINAALRTPELAEEAAEPAPPEAETETEDTCD